MLRGVGKALQEALDGEKGDKPSPPSSSPLLNAQRRRIFEYLCLRPFVAAGRLTRDLGISSSSAAWHLRSLVAVGLIAYKEGPKTYHPKDFVDAQDENLFTVLGAPNRSEVLRCIIDSPGISQVELSEAIRVGRQTAGKIVSELRDLGLVVKVEDGRFARWYPTNLLREKQEAQRARSRGFVDRLLETLEDGRLNPQVLKRTDRELQIRIGKGRGKGVLSLPLDPYGAIVV